MIELILDTETTTKGKGHPHDPDNKLVSYSLRTAQGETRHYRFSDPDFLTVLRSNAASADRFIGFNSKFDLLWLRRHDAVLSPSCEIFDCSIAEYVLASQQKALPSLNGCLEEYGLELKKDAVAELWALGIDTPDIPAKTLEEYNNWDVDSTYALYQVQLILLSPKQLNLVLLMGEDQKTLIEAEANGIKFDHEAAQRRVDETGTIVMETESQLEQFLPPMPDWVRFNWDSGDQLSAFLYGGTVEYGHSTTVDSIYKSGKLKGTPFQKRARITHEVQFPRIFRPLDGTELAKTVNDPSAKTRFYSTSSDVLGQLTCKNKQQRDIIQRLAERAQAIKVKEMIIGMQERSKLYNWVDYIHGQFNQTIAATGRLSSSNPNLQNSPPELDELFVSRYA